MVVTYKFTIPREQPELTVFQRAQTADTILYEWTNKLRNLTKYPAEATPDVVLAEQNRLYDEWWALLNEYSIDPWSE